MATSTRRGTGATGTNWTSLASVYDGGTGTFASNSNTTVDPQAVDITGYGFSADLTSNGQLFSVEATVAQYVTNAARYDPPTVQGYVGTTPLGTEVSLAESTTSTNTETVTLNGITLADIIDANFKIVFRANRSATQSATANLDYVDVTITYTAGKGYWGTLPL